MKYVWFFCVVLSACTSQHQSPQFPQVSQLHYDPRSDESSHSLPFLWMDISKEEFCRHVYCVSSLRAEGERTRAKLQQIIDRLHHRIAPSHVPKPELVFVHQDYVDNQFFVRSSYPDHFNIRPKALYRVHISDLWPIRLLPLEDTCDHDSLYTEDDQSHLTFPHNAHLRDTEKFARSLPILDLSGSYFSNIRVQEAIGIPASLAIMGEFQSPFITADRSYQKQLAELVAKNFGIKQTKEIGEGVYLLDHPLLHDDCTTKFRFSQRFFRGANGILTSRHLNKLALFDQNIAKMSLADLKIALLSELYHYYRPLVYKNHEEDPWVPFVTDLLGSRLGGGLGKVVERYHHDDLKRLLFVQTFTPHPWSEKESMIHPRVYGIDVSA